MIDFESLIELVRVEPCLYDTSHVDYTKLRLKDELWDQIGAQLGIGGATAREQWRKLRECHREAMRRQRKRKAGDRTRMKPWTHQVQMEFLLPYMKSRSGQEDSFASLFDEDDNPARWIAVAGEEDVKGQSGEDTTSETIQYEVPAKKGKSPRPPSPSSDVKPTHSTLQQRHPTFQQQQHHPTWREDSRERDALYLFFMSMYNTTRRLPALQQLAVRDEVYRAVSTAERQSTATAEAQGSDSS